MRTTMPSKDSYHHGDLKEALVSAALQQLAALGPDRFSMREVARQAGVSAAAVKYHFAGVSGLLTEIATRGHNALAAELEAAFPQGHKVPSDLLVDIGLAYLNFALEHRGMFLVMFRKDLIDPDTPTHRAARNRSFATLNQAAQFYLGQVNPGTPANVEEVALGAWSLVHGAAHLVLDGKVACGLTTEATLALFKPIFAAYRP